MTKLKNLTNKVSLKLTGMALAVAAALPAGVFAQNGIGEGAQQARPPELPADLTTVFQTIAQVLIFLIGAIAVIMLIIGGFRYVISSGDPEAVKSAKNTILYAIVGIVVAFLAYAAVNFVVTQLQGGTN